MTASVSRSRRAVLAMLVCVSLAAASLANVFDMGPGLTSLETVPVGNPGNAADTRHVSPGFGAVDYTFNIGTHEVTAGQYTVFLNAVAADDAYGLYNPDMWSSAYGCGIQRIGTAGDYEYSVAADWANRPVNFVSWGDAARFANWLHNGQPTGGQDLTTTEDGAYYLNGAATDSALLAVTRKADWIWAIPTQDEWYKAAYHKNDGVTGNYWSYPMSSDTVPGNQLIAPDPGNSANFNDGGYTLGSPYYRTDVGAFENSASPYGTFDQGGNVWEWNEAVIASSRGLRGGSFVNGELRLNAMIRAGAPPTTEDHWRSGFRVVQVPEPGALSLLALGGAALIRRRRRTDPRHACRACARRGHGRC